jgi:flagellar P-ring protein precursor FlgI
MKKLLFCLLVLSQAAPAQAARLKDIARIQDSRGYALVGYGLVVGLAGTGDSDTNRATRQSMVNVLKSFNVTVAEDDLSSRNTAAVMVTATLGSFSEKGDVIDVQASSLADARALTGGTLLLTPLYGPDRKLYALAQGALSVGGYQFEVNSNAVRKNHTTVGQIPRGATVEQAALADGLAGDKLNIILNEPDFTTAERAAAAIRAATGRNDVKVVHAARIELETGGKRADMPALIAAIEKVEVDPDNVARVVVNERTGTVVAGANVRLGEVSVSQGNLIVEVSTRFEVSQPEWLIRPGAGVRTVVVPDTILGVKEPVLASVQLQEGATVADLVQALARVNLTTRDVINVLQAIKRAGALHAELVIQ